MEYEQYRYFLSNFGKHLNKLRIYRNFDSISSFGIAYNNGKPYNNMSAFLKGKNIKFNTFFRLGKTLDIDIPDLLDTDKQKDFKPLSNDSEEYWAELFRFNTNLIRTNKKITQLSLEQELNILRENITNYETGRIKPELATMVAFATALKVRPFRLFAERDQSSSNQK